MLQAHEVRRPKTCDLYRAQGQQTAKVNRHKTGGTHRVPSRGGRKPKGLAARVCPRCDVKEAREAVTIQPWVEKAERGLALRKSVVIKQ